MLEFNSTAANDTLFKHQRHRTSQIVSTVAPIANYPSKLRIYLTNSSSYWQVKCFLKGKTYSKSLRTTTRGGVGVVENEQTYLRLNLPESKKHDKPIVTLRNAVFIYQRLKRLNVSIGMAKPTDYVFMPELTDRSTVLIYLGWQFKFIQELAGIEANAMNGKNRTLYSLRHTAITFRLLYGGAIDLLTLARNARTSVDMIEKFYSSNLSAEMNIDLLQGRRR